MRPSLFLFEKYDHELFSKVNSSKAKGKFVVVDPQDTDQLLYLTRKEYLIFNVNALANAEPLDVLLRPGDSTVPPVTNEASEDRKPSSTSTDSPAPSMVDPSNKGEPGGSRSFGTYSRIHNPHFSAVLKPSQLSVKEDGGLSGAKFRDLFIQWGEILSVRLGNSIMDPSVTRSMSQVGSYLANVFKHEGPARIVIKIKIAVYCVNSYLARSPLKCTRHLGAPVALAGGLPRFLPLVIRGQIRAGHTRSIRLWVSVLSIYKGIHGYSTTPSFDTISSPAPYVPFDGRCDQFTEHFAKWINPGNSGPDFSRAEILSLTTAGPNSSYSILSAPFDAFAWSVRTENTLLEFCSEVGCSAVVTGYEEILARYSSDEGKVCRAAIAKHSSTRIRKSATQTPILGRLSLKYEPAGKIRVFAIVDLFTQSALKPLHDWMFKLLKGLTTDATFDQIGVLSSFSKANSKDSIYSFDLSSATDLIPLELTMSILEILWGPPART